MLKALQTTLLIFFTTFNVFAGKYFDFTPRARDAYDKVFSLRFGEARAALDVLRQQEPDNQIGIFVENYLEVLTIFVDDDEAAYNRFSKNMDARLSQMARGDSRSPYFRYTQAEIRLQWAVLRGRFGDYLSSLSDIKQAYALLEENQRRFPDFIANKKSLGILHAMVGNVPDDYRWAVRMLGGMSGTIEQGMSELDAVVAYAKTHDFIFEEETLIAYGLLQLHLNNQDVKAWNTLKNSKLSPKKNPLAAYALANVAIRTGRTDEAIKVLQDAPSGGAYHPFYYRDYLLGLAKLYRLDWDANLPLQRFVGNFPGKNSVKEAYQKLAWHQLLNGNTRGYYTFMQNVKQNGTAQSDPDKVALREANSGEIPDVRLLKARLLFDGGYYARAFDLLKNNSADYQNHPRNNLEYTYRMGRIAHKMGKNADAIRYYESAVALGSKQPWYFACNAALQLGMLYEGQKDYKNARFAYQRCLNISPEEYASSLHTKAKAGLNRIH